MTSSTKLPNITFRGRPLADLADAEKIEALAHLLRGMPAGVSRIESLHLAIYHAGSGGGGSAEEMPTEDQNTYGGGGGAPRLVVPSGPQNWSVNPVPQTRVVRKLANGDYMESGSFPGGGYGAIIPREEAERRLLHLAAGRPSGVGGSCS